MRPKRRFIEQYFYSGDLAAIVRTGPGQAAGQELTNSRRLLLAAINRFQGQQIDSAADGRLERKVHALRGGQTNQRGAGVKSDAFT